MEQLQRPIAYYHLPGLFEFYDFYRAFLPLYRAHREYFYDWCEIGSIYGAPMDCIWGGGRIGFGEATPRHVFQLMEQYGISSRLTFSNLLLRREHLSDTQCNHLCRMLSEESQVHNGVIVASDLLTEYLREQFPRLYLVSSTTKVLSKYDEMMKELHREEFQYVVLDFRLNHHAALMDLPVSLKNKIEFLCNECCFFGCEDRRNCYENVSRKSLGEDCEDHICQAPYAKEGYRFSKAMKNPAFISLENIRDFYLPKGFSQFKIEGRSLGSALLLEFILYYMTRPECQLLVREEIYLENTLDLF